MKSNDEIKQECGSILRYVAYVHFRDVETEFLEDAYIAGGSIRSMLLNEPVKDFDIFLRSNRLVDKIRAISNAAFISKNAVSVYKDGTQIQIITNSIDDPEKMIGEFDFTMNHNYYCPVKDELVVKDLVHIMLKQLVINKNCRNKLGTLARITKFVNRGYSVPSKIDMVMIGVDITKTDQIHTIEELIAESRMYFSDTDVEDMRGWNAIGISDDFKNDYQGSST